MTEPIEFELVCFILNDGQASKALRIAKKYGVKGGTICLGHGTVQNKWLEMLDLNDTHKELLWTIASKQTALRAMEGVAEEMHFHKAHHGIAFMMPLAEVAGMTIRKMHSNAENEPTTKNEVVEVDYYLIFTVVDKGQSEEVVDAANAVGAGGATVINARGCGIHEVDTLFAMQIEPEKEMILIVAESGSKDAIVKSISEHLKLEEPGNGIIFVTAATAAVGLRQR